MKKWSYLTLITLMVFSFMIPEGLFAQKQGGKKRFNREEFMSKRNAYIISEVPLDDKEAKTFIPVENEMRSKMFEAGRDCRKLSRELKKKNNANDDEYAKLLDCQQNARQKETQIEQEYYDRLKQILPIEKLYKYQEAEAKFTRDFVKSQDE